MSINKINYNTYVIFSTFIAKFNTTIVQKFTFSRGFSTFIVVRTPSNLGIYTTNSFKYTFFSRTILPPVLYFTTYVSPSSRFQTTQHSYKMYFGLQETPTGGNCRRIRYGTTKTKQKVTYLFVFVSRVNTRKK